MCSFTVSIPYKGMKLKQKTTDNVCPVFDWRWIWRINSPIDVSLDWNLALSLAYIYMLISPPVFRRWKGTSRLGGWFWPLWEECAATSLPYFLSFYLEFMWLPVLAQFGKLAPRMVASAKDGKDGMRNGLVNLKIALSIPHFAACNHRGLVWKKGRWGSSCCLDCLFECGGGGGTQSSQEDGKPWIPQSNCGFQGSAGCSSGSWLQ